MNCQCCGKPKARLHRKNSMLIESMELLLCTDCKNAGKEPRHMVVLAAASGIDVRDFVVKRLYCGEELTARDVMH